ncbi:hypothetical protein L873DRAFT_1809195, partial [Choiromyces venosus 120613-1]
MQAHFPVSLLFSVHSVRFFFNPYNSLDALMRRMGKVRRGVEFNSVQGCVGW